MQEIKKIHGGVVAPQGFTTAGVACGIKKIKGRNDLALIVSETDAVAAGVFTTSVVKAHCVINNQEHLREKTARAIVVNSGNANACNGARGMEDVKRITRLAAGLIGADERQVFSASTGVIGHSLPMDKVEAGIRDAASKLHGGDGSDTTEAILTTDTFSKEIALEVVIGGARARLGATAKGSGMIEPNMATMLAFITTDAAIAKPVLQDMLGRVAEKTFNTITVDGDTSTNDMCLILANGMAGNVLISDPDSPEGRLFEQALHYACLHLAKEIARDGEGATKLVEVIAKNVRAPRKVAKTIANSPLVKTALFGNDPNWGRILAAAGRAGVEFDPLKVEIELAGMPVYASGAPVAFDPVAVSEKMKAKEISIVIDFHQSGGETACVYTCDFSYDYVKINADYHT